MDDKTNLYVFEKKEVFLIFIFMILIAITSFVLGVKIGKTYTYPQLSDSLSRDQSPVKDQLDSRFQSVSEEKVDQIMQNNSDEPLIDDTQMLKDTLIQEFTQPNKPVPQVEDTPQTSVPALDLSQNTNQVKAERDLSGKWTVQVGSFPVRKEAEVFADGFQVRGHDAIINQVNLPSRGGIWYRVSIGLFNTASEATEYMRNNKELFSEDNAATPMQL